MWANTLIFVALLPILVYSSPFSSCPSGDPRPDSISIPNCSDNGTRCEISKSQAMEVFFNFTAPTLIDKMYGRCHVSIAGRWINIPTGQDGDVCANLIMGECPLQPGVKASYSVTQKIPYYAIVGIKTSVRIQAVDGEDNVVGCIMIKVHIVK